MVQKAKIEKFFGDRYEFYSKGTYDYEEQVYLGRIWDNELEHWVPEQFRRRHKKVKVTSHVVFDKRCNLRTTDGQWKNLQVSRLIYQAFHPEWDMFDNPRKHPINHKKEDETCNNDLDNLELSTPKENCNYGTRNQRAGDSIRIQRRTSTAWNRSKPIICCETHEFFWSLCDAIRAIGKPLGGVGVISMCCRGLRPSAYGYHWRYATEEEIAQRS